MARLFDLQTRIASDGDSIFFMACSTAVPLQSELNTKTQGKQSCVCFVHHHTNESGADDRKQIYKNTQKNLRKENICWVNIILLQKQNAEILFDYCKCRVVVDGDGQRRIVCGLKQNWSDPPLGRMTVVVEW